MNKPMKLFLITLVVLLSVQLFRLWMLKRQVSNHNNYWHVLAEKEAPQNAIWYIALGDSAGQGIGASHPTKGYVGRVADAMAQKYGRPVHVVNLSVSGDKVADIIRDQIPQLKRLSLPEGAVITVEGGANDMQDFDPVRFESEFAKMLSLLPVGTYVSDVPYFGKSLFPKREDLAVQANEIVHILVKKYEVHLVHLHESTEKHSSWFNNAADVFHPNDRGYKWWFEAFNNTIK